MSHAPVIHEARLQRMDEAGAWLQRLHGSGQDEGVVEAWLDWCQRDPLNQQAFDELALIWEASAGLHGTIPAQADAPAMPARRRLAMAASLAGVGLATIALGSWWLTGSPADQVLTSELSSAVGVNSTQTLHDGSVLELGGGTRATVSFSRHARRVELHEGEVFVVVRKDPGRPFSVDAGRLTVIATGTEFNVLRTSERTTVTVAEGSVDALYDGQGAQTPNMSLQPSQQLVYSHASRRVVVRQADLSEALAWRTGTLHFHNEPLSEVVAKVNRYSEKQILIEDPRVAALSFTGTARTDRIDGWLLGLPHIFPVTIQEPSEGRHLIAPERGAGDD